MEAHTQENIRRHNYLWTELGAAYHEAAVKLGLSDSVMTILYTLQENQGRCPLGEIPRLTGIPKQTINSALRKLESQGVVGLEVGQGRKKTVVLTPRGAELAEGTAGRLMALEQAIFAAWTQEEQEGYLTLTQRYLEDFREKCKEL